MGSLPACPDLITGADIVYQSEHFAALLHSLEHLAAPHTLIYLSFRLRGILSRYAHCNNALTGLKLQMCFNMILYGACVHPRLTRVQLSYIDSPLMSDQCQWTLKMSRPSSPSLSRSPRDNTSD